MKESLATQRPRQVKSAGAERVGNFVRACLKFPPPQALFFVLFSAPLLSPGFSNALGLLLVEGVLLALGAYAQCMLCRLQRSLLLPACSLEREGLFFSPLGCRLTK